jgi:amino acid transporter
MSEEIESSMPRMYLEGDININSERESMDFLELFPRYDTAGAGDFLIIMILGVIFVFFGWSGVIEGESFFFGSDDADTDEKRFFAAIELIIGWYLLLYCLAIVYHSLKERPMS